MIATSTDRKKLIEVALPLEAINKASAREKNIRHGHPSTLHLWWARRPLAACRAVLFAQLVDDPSAWPENFVSEEAQEVERQRLFRIIEQLVLWENSTNEAVLNAARWEIARSVAWRLGEEPPNKDDGKAILSYLREKGPPVYDPFCGGGSIPLEAQRLGLRSFGSDLNPMAVLICRALIEIPPKFAGQRPVNPEARKKLKAAARWNGKGAQGLAEDVRFYGKWIRDEAENRIGHLYPQVEVTDETVQQQPRLEPLKGQKLKIIAWLWSRTVVSPNPAAKGAQVPLASSFMLSTKEGKKAWIEPVIDAAAAHGYQFVVRSGSLNKSDEDIAKAGTKSGRGSNFTCLLTGTPITSDYVKAEGKAGRMGTRLMAIVAVAGRERIYLQPDQRHEEIAASAKPAWEPDGSLPNDPRSFWTVQYGLTEFRDLFTQRQLLALTTLSNLVIEAREKVLVDAFDAGFPKGNRLAEGGTGAEAYADAVATYLGEVASKLTAYHCTVGVWRANQNKSGRAFGRQTIPMVWDFPECNPFGGAGGDWYNACKDASLVLEGLGVGNSGQVLHQVAQVGLTIPDKALLISTDPPYYDNVGYADLADFFYVWIRQCLRTIYPKLLSTLVTPKTEELVASPYRHGGKEAAEEFFLSGMTSAMCRIETLADAGCPTVIYYAFRQSETDSEGVSSTGWQTFLEAVVNAGFSIDGTWPMRTEQSAALKSKMNALASSIVIVCRRREAGSTVITRAAFLAALARELPAALKLLQAGNIAPVDLAQASIGPGMGIFTRYAKVLEADDSAMTVKTALQLINAALDDYLSEQESEYDAETRYAITWFETHGMEAASFGEADVLAKARNVAVSGVTEAGLLDSKGGKVRLLRRDEMPAEWDPITDARLTTWECAQHLIRVLETDGETAAAALLNKVGSHGDVTRDLAYRLYQICERKKWTEEARAYNGLVIAWPELEKLASQQASADSQETAQAELI